MIDPETVAEHKLRIAEKLRAAANEATIGETPQGRMSLTDLWGIAGSAIIDCVIEIIEEMRPPQQGVAAPRKRRYEE